MALRSSAGVTLRGAGDFHVHLRQSPQLREAVVHTAAQFDTAVVMPNTDPPVRTVAEALQYKESIDASVPSSLSFSPLHALYVTTESTTPAEVFRVHQSPHVIGFKLYPQGATTNSDRGVAGIASGSLDDALAEMERLGVPLLVHAESGRPDVDVFDREAHFLRNELSPVLERFPSLRVVVEHITTKDAVTFVMSAGPNVAASVTAHHCLINRNHLLGGTLRPHHFCKPVAKREEHRKALLDAIATGSPKLYLGTDSAPHARGDKEAACGCAGVFTAHAALELYAEAFESIDALHLLPQFACENAFRFHGLPRPGEDGSPVREASEITLRRAQRRVPDEYPFASSSSGTTGGVVPFRAGEDLQWTASAARSNS